MSLGDHTVHLFDVLGHAVADRRGRLFGVEAKAGQGGAQVVSDGGDHLGAALDIAIEFGLHVVEGMGGSAHLQRACFIQRRRMRIRAEAFGGLGEQAHRAGQPPCHQPGQWQEQDQTGQEGQEDAGVPGRPQAGRRAHRGPLTVGQAQAGGERGEPQAVGRDGDLAGGPRPSGVPPDMSWVRIWSRRPGGG
jgi:hypothetical protein